MSDDPQESLDLFDEHEEIVSEDGKKVKERVSIFYPIYLQQLLFLQASFLLFQQLTVILYTLVWLFSPRKC